MDGSDKKISTKKGVKQPVILAVEDEESILALIKYNLEREGFKVLTASNGEEGLLMVSEKNPDLVLLDWMLPKLSGVEVCKQLRGNSKTKSVPIIMLTAKGEEGDVLTGLDSGADDYIVKPFSPGQLIARIKAVLRRIRPIFGEKLLEFEGLQLDQASQRVTYNEAEVLLGPTEFKILRHFMSHPDFVFSREQLLDAVWGNDIYVEIRTVDVHIRRLRKALSHTDPKLENLIRTVRSAGYALQKLEG